MLFGKKYTKKTINKISNMKNKDLVSQLTNEKVDIWIMHFHVLVHSVIITLTATRVMMTVIDQTDDDKICFAVEVRYIPGIVSTVWSS